MVGALEPASSPLNERQVVRLHGEYNLIHTCSLLAVTGGNIARGVVFLAVARACIGEWTRGGTIAAPSRSSEGVPILSIAESLDHPFETVRRHIHALVKDGLCTFGRRRVALANSGPKVPAILTYLTTGHDNLLQLIARVAPVRDTAPPLVGPPPEAGPVGAVVRAALDLSLTPIQKSRENFANWTSMIVWLAVAVLTVRHVTVDPALGRTLSQTATPDDLRRPVPIAVIAAVYGLPYATVWRHVHDLLAVGLLTQADGGLRMTNGNLTSAPLEPHVVAHYQYLLRKLREAIVQAGVDPMHISDFYLAGPPPYVPWPGQASPVSAST